MTVSKKIERSAFKKAASTASLLLTTEAIVSEIHKEYQDLEYSL